LRGIKKERKKKEKRKRRKKDASVTLPTVLQIHTVYSGGRQKEK